MRKKASNGERSIAVVERLQVKESDEAYRSKAPTPNAQSANKRQFDLEGRLLEFSARIIRLVDSLPNTRAANHIAGQLLRCGTSPYDHHGEVEAAESRKDFIIN